jgi:5'-nucleotidase
VKIWAPILVLATALTAGCQTQQKPTTSASVLDVSAPPQHNTYSTTAYQPTAGYQPAPANQHAAAPATTTTPPYMLPSAYPPPEPAPAITVVEAQPPSAVPASATAKAAPTRSAPKATQTSSTPSSSSNYTVKQGDTLYHIAKVHYGNGNQWQRIASANPGVSPTSLKVGQVLVIP